MAIDDKTLLCLRKVKSLSKVEIVDKAVKHPCGKLLLFGRCPFYVLSTQDTEVNPSLQSSHFRRLLYILSVQCSVSPVHHNSLTIHQHSPCCGALSPSVTANRLPSPQTTFSLTLHSAGYTFAAFLYSTW